MFESGLSKEEEMDLIGSLISDDFLRRVDLATFAEDILNLEIANHHRVWSELVAKHKKLAILASRDHGKSYFFSLAYVIWRAYYNWVPSVPDDIEFRSMPKFSLGYIISNTTEQAIKLLELVKIEIESNEKLHWLIPASKESWNNKTEIRLSNGCRLRARGYGQSTRGAHPCFIVCDDILNDETMFSEVTRKRQIDYFFSAITPMLIPHGQLIVVGTPLHEKDLYFELKSNIAYKFAEFPAIKDGKALWPERYSLEDLQMRKAEIGSTRFGREYLVQPISDDSSLFPEKILNHCFDYEFEMPDFLTKEDREELQVFTGVDLAISSNVGADYTVIFTIGLDRMGNRWILDIRRKRGLGFTEQLREINNVYRIYRPSRIYVEDNAFQRIFRDELVRRSDLPIEGFTTTARKKHSLEDGIPSLQILFENRKFVIPRKTQRDREITDQLISELKCFSFVNGKLQGLGNHDDMVMALWLAVEASRNPGISFEFV
jgi:hypothetical protein